MALLAMLVGITALPWFRSVASHPRQLLALGVLTDVNGYPATQVLAGHLDHFIEWGFYASCRRRRFSRARTPSGRCRLGSPKRVASSPYSPARRTARLKPGGFSEHAWMLVCAGRTRTDLERSFPGKVIPTRRRVSISDASSSRRFSPPRVPLARSKAA